VAKYIGENMVEYRFSKGIDVLHKMHNNGGSMKLHDLNDEVIPLVGLKAFKYIRIIQIKDEMYAVLLRDDMVVSAIVTHNCGSRHSSISFKCSISSYRDRCIDMINQYEPDLKEVYFSEVSPHGKHLFLVDE
jgi:hypothetical protein